MRRLFKLCAALLCATAFLSATTAWASSQPAIWRATSDSASVYLFGSMHFGHPSFFPLPDHVDRAFARAQVLAVEVNIDAISPEQATQAIAKYGQLPQGESLEQVLSDKVYQKLAKHSRQSGVPLSAFDRFQPWFVALQLVEAQIRQAELRPDLGIDLYFIQRASSQQRIDELETLESQLSLFGGLPLEQQERFLGQTLHDLGKSDEYLEEMASAWRRGDVPQLQALLIEPFALQDDKDSAKFFQKVFTERNYAMTDAVQTYLQGSETVFFVVGAGHMVGEQGIVQLLQNQGVRVERLAAEPQIEPQQRNIEPAR